MMKNGYASPPSSSPPTPSSPLPISVGPGNRRYSFSSSQSPSPPFSPPASSHTSAENLPLLHAVVDKSTPLRAPPLAFSLDRRNPSDESDSRSSCLKDLLLWLVLRCCSCCSASPRIPNPNPTHTGTAHILLAAQLCHMASRERD
ncbi:hypothetical protein ACSBR2_043205 [Camellia fascicularis]